MSVLELYFSGCVLCHPSACNLNCRTYFRYFPKSITNEGDLSVDYSTQPEKAVTFDTLDAYNGHLNPAGKEREREMGRNSDRNWTETGHSWFIHTTDNGRDRKERKREVGRK